MNERTLIKWIRNLELTPKEQWRGETGYMLHDIITALAEYQALKRVIKEDGIEVDTAKLAKYKWT